MYKVTKYPHGTFSWAGVMTSERETAIDFYRNLFGWETADLTLAPGMDLKVFQLEGENIAALSWMTPEMIEQGIPSHWLCEVTVDNADALVDVVTDTGGTILFGPMDMFYKGRMLYIQDPTGATLNLWQAGTQIGAGLVNMPGAMIWNELLTGDTAAAKSFYGGLLGWDFEDSESGYIYIFNKGRSNGGILQMDESFGDTPPHWRTYFHVADIDWAIKQVQASAGKILIPKLEAPGVGHFAFVSDPMGASFYLLQPYTYDTWEE